MLRRFLLALLVPALAGATLFAQTLTEEEEVRANPGRPTLSTPATLTPVGYLQFETGTLTARHSPEFSTQTNINEVIKLSISRRLQWLAAFQPVAEFRGDRPTEVTGIGGVSAGLQVMLHGGEGSCPTVSLSYTRSIYGGAAPGFDIGSALNSGLILVSADVHKFHYDANIFANDVKQGRTHRGQFGQSLSISHPLSARFQLTGELYHFTQPFVRGHAADSLLALAFSPNKLLVFDGGFSRGLTETSTRWQVFAGFTYLMPHKLWR